MEILYFNVSISPNDTGVISPIPIKLSQCLNYEEETEIGPKSTFLKLSPKSSRSSYVILLETVNRVEFLLKSYDDK